MRTMLDVNEHVHVHSVLLSFVFVFQECQTLFIDHYRTLFAVSGCGHLLPSIRRC